MSKQRVVICIDDEEMILESLSMEIASGFPELDIELLSDNGEAETLARSLLEEGREVVAIVCDYIMPGRKGDAVLAALHAILPNARTIMLTGQSSLEGVTHAINHAALYRYLTKPWDRADLALTLRSAIESYTQEQTIVRQNAELMELNAGLEIKVSERTMELIELNTRLQVANTQLQEYLEIIDSHVLISRIDHEGEINYVSNAFCTRSGYAREELMGKNYWLMMYPSISEEDLKAILNCIQHGEIWRGEVAHTRKNGETYWVQEIISPDLRNESIVIGFTSIHQDITDRKIIEEISITDPLTGLYNRRYFNLIIERELGRAKRKGEQLGFMLLDVDHFKAYNDHYGHPEGDKVLQALGGLLKTLFSRGSDYVFRVGGEEFAVLTIIQDEDETRALAERILLETRNLAIPHEYNSASAFVSLSIGALSVFPAKHDTNMEEIYHKVDVLLYRAKQDGRNRVVRLETA